MRSKRFIFVDSVFVGEIALALFTSTSMPPKLANGRVDRRAYRLFVANIHYTRQASAASRFDFLKIAVENVSLEKRDVG